MNFIQLLLFALSEKLIRLKNYVMTKLFWIDILPDQWQQLEEQTKICLYYLLSTLLCAAVSLLPLQTHSWFVRQLFSITIIVVSGIIGLLASICHSWSTVSWLYYMLHNLLMAIINFVQASDLQIKNIIIVNVLAILIVTQQLLFQSQQDHTTWSLYTSKLLLNSLKSYTILTSFQIIGEKVLEMNYWQRIIAVVFFSQIGLLILFNECSTLGVFATLLFYFLGGILFEMNRQDNAEKFSRLRQKVN